ncbi:MAG: copper amine oxidase N-terminal domain-containing protein [Clostridiales bacterium]|jgi:hypothetical protein|nr:copper amine oxidase N-terminal domain-containing protein [Clostridiales bacterium]
MKTCVKLAASVLAAALLAPSAVFAEETPSGNTLPAQEAKKEYFSKCDGSVTLVKDGLIRVQDARDSETDFTTAGAVLSDETGAALTLSDIKVGDSVTAYFVKPFIMTYIYPPRFSAAVLLKNIEDSPGNAIVDFFDENGLSSDGSLKLNVSAASSGKVFDTEGNAAAKPGETPDLKNKPLLVYYSVTTRSAPPQTSGDKIIVLPEAPEAPVKPVPPIAKAPDMEIPQIKFDENSAKAVYVGEKLVSQQPYVKDGVIFAPLRAVCDEVGGATLSWDEKERSVTVVSGTARTLLIIGKKEYTIGPDMFVPSAAPEIRAGYTYAPIDTISRALGLQYAVADGKLSFFRAE